MGITDTIITEAEIIAVKTEEGAKEVCVFVENDPYGLLMAILGMSIVFTVLIMLFVIFNNTPALFKQTFKEKLKAFFSFKKKKPTIEETAEEAKEAEHVQEISGEINAAIATAIYLYRNELHDYEDTILTIKKVSRTYSPWSSKIYGLRNMPKN